MQSTIFTEIDWAQQINDLLDGLNASNDHVPSGLIAENVANSEAVVRISNFYVSGEYYADQVVEALSSVDQIDWSAYDNAEIALGPVWDAISGCEV